MNLVIDADGDAVLELNGIRLDGRSSSMFSYQAMDGDFYLFEPEGNHQKFYDHIRHVPIDSIPDGVQFEIYNISYQEITKPLELLPSPFNVLNFFKTKDRFMVRFACISEEGSEYAWPDFYYLEELKSQANNGAFDHITIKEQEGFQPFEGGFVVEIDHTDAQIPEEAFLKALSALHSLLEEVNAVIGDKAGMEELLDLWSKQQDRADQNYWSNTLESYPYILTQVLESPLLLLEGVGYSGSIRISSKATDVASFITDHVTLDKVLLLKVLSPVDFLMGEAFNGTHLISETVIGHINHQLALRDQLITALEDQVSEAFHDQISCHLIIGNSQQLSKEHQKIFDRFRVQFSSVTISTFDEFMQQVSHLLHNYDEQKETRVIRLRTTA